MNSMSRSMIVVIVVVACIALLSTTAFGSIGMYVGKNLTEDGSVLLGGYGDEPSGHWVEIVPAREHDPDATMEVGITEDAWYPGELFEIPQVERTNKYIASKYSQFAGFPAPLMNGGLNEHGVAGRDIMSSSRQELLELTPDMQKGLNYSDLARIAMQRATSAREAAEIVGEMVDKYNYATYGGNSHIFADSEEGWLVIQFAGNENLWVAERLGPDDIRCSVRGVYMEEIPLDYQEHPDYMGSDNLISFAEEQGWYDRDSGEPFHVDKVYQHYRPENPGGKYSQAMEDWLEERAPEVSLEDMMEAVRHRDVSTDSAGYGQVAHLRDGVHDELNVLWVAVTGAVTTPFIPYHIGVEEVPPEYQQHRYLHQNSPETHLNPDFKTQEATEFAGRTFKRLMYFTAVDADKFLPEVVEALEAFEANIIGEQEEIERTAEVLYEIGEDELARDHLTRYSNKKAMEGLQLGNDLLASIEARVKLLYGVDTPEGHDINTWGYFEVNLYSDDHIIDDY